MNRYLLAVALTAAVLTAQPQFPQSQNPNDAAPAVDPPSRAARLNWFSGDVAFQPATVDTWTTATLNYPLTTGDHIFVNPGARAELHIDGSAIRLNSNSNFGFLNLSDNVAQISFNEGSLEFRLRQVDPNDTYEIDTPNGAVTLLRAGDYRIDTDPARNATMVTVRTGQAEMYQDGASLLITAHQTAWFHDGSAPEVNAENVRDDFDAFVNARNNAEDNLPRPGYVPETMVGYQDLYAYGHWINDPLYGWVWIPPVVPGWAPYTTGRWAFVHPWGWTWVDESPWGFAPFHYGRWAQLRGFGWAWIPGAPAYRPVYAPALVGFIGGGGFSLGVSIGWFPLGPREPWIPAWGASPAYVSRVNIMHVTNVNVINVTYVNRQSAVVVSQADFAAARPVAAAMIRVNPAQLQTAAVLGSNPQIVPARTSVVIGASRAAPIANARPVVARTPPPPSPISFQAQQQALTQNKGLPLSPAQVNQLRGQQPAAAISRTPVRTIMSAPANTNTPPNRMNSRPPTAPQVQPSGATPPAPARPAYEPAPRMQPPAQQAQPAPPPYQATPRTSGTPPAKQTRAVPKTREQLQQEERRQ